MSQDGSQLGALPTGESSEIFNHHCIVQVPLSEITSVGGGRRSSKKRKLTSNPSPNLARDIPCKLQNGYPGNVVITNPHDAATIYMSGCYGKWSQSKGPPLGCFAASEHLILTPCEAMYLTVKNAAVIHGQDGETSSLDELWTRWRDYDAHFPYKYHVYRHFREKGYTVRSGLTYGGDFVLYTGNPDDSHAPYVVRVVGSAHSPPPSWNDINSVRRVSESVAKELVVAFVTDQCLTRHDSEVDVRTVLLKRWLPHREREIVNKHDDK